MSHFLPIFCSSTKETVHVPFAWAPRWNIFQDISSEGLEIDRITWPYEVKELMLWCELNRRMDEGERSRESSTSSSEADGSLILVSSIEVIVRYMQPATDEWLLHCEIDRVRDPLMKKDYYSRLGHHIRQRGVRYPYAIATERVYGIHYNFSLPYDPAYVDMEDNEDTDDEDIDTSGIMDEDQYIIFTGILHTAWKKIEYDLDSSVEVPWYLIDWDDVCDFTSPLHPRSNTWRALAGRPLLPSKPECNVHFPFASSIVEVERDVVFKINVPEFSLLLKRYCQSILSTEEYVMTMRTIEMSTLQQIITVTPEHPRLLYTLDHAISLLSLHDHQHCAASLPESMRRMAFFMGSDWMRILLIAVRDGYFSSDRQKELERCIVPTLNSRRDFLGWPHISKPKLKLPIKGILIAHAIKFGIEQLSSLAW